MVVGSIVIFKRILGSHRPGCEYFNKGTKARTREWFTFALDGAYGRTWTSALIRLVCTGASSFLQYLTCRRVVSDGKWEGPGFARLHEADNRIKIILNDHRVRHEGKQAIYQKPALMSSGIPPLRKVLSKLRTDLREDFNSTRDWEGVQTRDGETLLHVSLQLISSNALD